MLLKNFGFNIASSGKSCLRARLDFKGHFLFYLFYISKPMSMKKNCLKTKKFTKGEGRGGAKSVKSVTYYLNGPLVDFSFNVSLSSSKEKSTSKIQQI